MEVNALKVVQGNTFAINAPFASDLDQYLKHHIRFGDAMAHPAPQAVGPIRRGFCIKKPEPVQCRIGSS